MIELILIVIFYSIRKFRNRPTEKSRKENNPVVVKETKSNVIPFPSKRIGK
jgi:hypothetical protein